MIGRLGVLRINKDRLEDAGSGNGNIIHEKHWINIYWDTQELEATFGKTYSGSSVWRYSTYGTNRNVSEGLNPLDVFYLPVRIMDSDPDGSDYESPMLTGLLLLPTGKHKGEYRRVGQFELSERSLPYDQREESFKPLTKPTGLMDGRFYLAKQKHGQYTFNVV
jgi:hypothetical protein